MIVISDTTAISNLLTIEKEELLHALFGRVIIPPAVCAELLAWHADLPAWIEVITISDAARVERYRQSVHAGEAEAICLAAELNCDWLLLAKKQDLIPAVRTLTDRLRDQAGFFLTETVRQEVLRLAGE